MIDLAVYPEKVWQVVVELEAQRRRDHDLLEPLLQSAGTQRRKALLDEFRNVMDKRFYAFGPTALWLLCGVADHREELRQILQKRDALSR